MAMNGGTAAVAGRRHRRRPVMAEINVTPMVDVMLVLLIIFMVSAPLLTVGVPLDLPQTQAKTLDQDKEPLTVSVNQSGQVYLQNTEIAVEELVPKLKAITEARGGAEERIFVRGDRQVDYGTVMKVMGRISAAGFRRVALVTDSEQQASARSSRDEGNEDGIHHIGGRACRGVAVERVVALSDVAARVVDRRSARRPRDRVRLLQDHRRQQGRAESRDAEAASGKGRRGEPGRGPHRESGGEEGSQGRARAAAGAGSKARRVRAGKKASRGEA